MAEFKVSEIPYTFSNGIRSIEISKNGLYAPWPIPAARVLVHNKEWAALHVLCCLVTYLGYGKSSNLVFPTIKTICESTGHGKATVQKAINLLARYGFIIKEKRATARFKRNYYQILSACFDYEKMNDYARMKSPPRNETATHLHKNQINQQINSEQVPLVTASQIMSPLAADFDDW